MLPKNSSEFIDNRTELPPKDASLNVIIQGWPHLANKRTAGFGMKKLSPLMRRREWVIRHNLASAEEELDDRQILKRLKSSRFRSPRRFKHD